tara:strand:+ start:41345 stop:42766 length:1422 start_codon:yes stop_codon:yes gene_type:complete
VGNFVFAAVASSPLFLSVFSQPPRVTEAAEHDRSNSDASRSRWASKIAARFHCELSDELVDWFDREMWNESGRGEYRQPIHPSELLVDAPESIWPALMPCDLLPISGNSAGDWLCMRVDQHDRVAEIVQWYHGGGDWIPWGRTLSEAFAFDALSLQLPGTRRRHSIPAENPRPDAAELARFAEVDGVAADPLLDWAAKYLPGDVAALLSGKQDSETVAAKLIQHHVAEVAVRCEAVQDALHQSITAFMDPKLAAEWNVPWEQMVEWTFDAKRIPDDRYAQIAELSGEPFVDQQDWAAAKSHCRAVTEIDPTLAWAWEILGYTAERDHDIDSAMSAYRSASACSVFTDQSVRLRTHWETGCVGKFSVARMMQMQPSVVSEDDYLRRVGMHDPQQRRREVCDYWRDLATTAFEQGRFADAYLLERNAGWDLGAEPMTSFGDLLDSIVRSANHAGQAARAAVAQAHRACLAARYRI